MMFLMLALVAVASGELFTFRQTTSVSSTENWLNSEIPCVGDRIRFDGSPVVAFMDHNMDVESITLPNDGMLVFSDAGVMLSGDNEWQCAKGSQSESKETYFIQDGDRDTSYFNPSNWNLDEKPFLHMNQVPSEHDDVVISSLTSAQIYLDRPVSVNTFSLYHRTRMTTEDFNVLIRSMEGQFQFIIPRPWARESDVGGIQRMLADDPITVRNKKLATKIEGRVNPNSRNETLAAICAYVHCEPIANKCVKAFVPFGHCCPVCGGKIELIAWDMDLEAAKTRVDRIAEELHVKEHSFVTVERITMNPLASKYQVVLALMSNATFDEKVFDVATRRIIDDLALSLSIRKQKSVLDFTIHLSKFDRTIRTSSKLIACFIYFPAVIGLIGLFAYRNLELRISRREMFSPTIKYRRQTDDVTIELKDVAGEHSVHLEEKPEDVEDQENINPNFEESENSESESADSEVAENKNASGEEEEVDVKDVLKTEPSEQTESENEIEAEEEDVASDVGDPDCINPNFCALELPSGEPEELVDAEAPAVSSSDPPGGLPQKEETVSNTDTDPVFPEEPDGETVKSSESQDAVEENESKGCPTPPSEDILLVDL